MSEGRDSAWLRKTLCDEIESLREGKSDHIRAKGVAMLAREVLKSVEVEMVFRQQQTELDGTSHTQLGALPLCKLPALSAPAVEPAQIDESKDELTTTAEPHVEHDLTEVAGFKAGDRVECPNGKLGTIKSVKSSGRIEVSEDEGGVFPYASRHLQCARVEPKVREPVRSPVVPQGPVPRFVAGRDASSSR